MPASKRPAAAPFAPPAGWTVERGGRRMSRTVTTKDFLEAVALIDAVAPVAEELQHHPDLHLERWNRLRVTTWSHDVGGLTSRDLRLARALNRLLAARGFKPRAAGGAPRRRAGARGRGR